GQPPGERGVPLPQTAPGAELDVVDLWPGEPPGGGGPRATDGYRFDETSRGVISGVATPCLLVIRPEKPNGAAMLVAAGGGYRKIDIGHEGIPAGTMLAKAGITAFILVYRLPGEGWAEGPDAPRQDAQRAMRLIRSDASAFGIDPTRIGLMGFSAGGHLMGEAAVSPDTPLYDAVDARDAISAAAALAALIYPVITLMAPYDRTIMTRRVLIGDSPTDAERRAYSVDAQVTDRTPPTFLVQASDDPIAVVDHPLMMYRALRAKRIPAEMHLFERGGHGFGLGVPGTPVAVWPTLFLAWIRGRGFLKV
ncbi:alpha/beta hydrolase, partial [Methylobacterium haplocladii]